MKLREAVKKTSEREQHQQLCGPGFSHIRSPSQPSPPTMRTEATRLPTAGERKRVARQPGASQRGGGGLERAKNIGTSGEGGGQRAVDRGVANDIIRQRQEDEQSNVITENYSRLRIK